MTPPRLLLDEMHTPVVAEELGRRGHDVIAVAAEPDLRALTDQELLTWAGEQGRRVVTENVKDFRPLLGVAEEAGVGVVFTSSRRFPRSRKNPAPLIEALDAWLRRPHREPRPAEDWLIPAPPPGAH
ncbi:MAG: DUF5615 family PIN-like protein [Acidimicrobiia bacterium]